MARHQTRSTKIAAFRVAPLVFARDAASTQGRVNKAASVVRPVQPGSEEVVVRINVTEGVPQLIGLSWLVRVVKRDAVHGCRAP